MPGRHGHCVSSKSAPAPTHTTALAPEGTRLLEYAAHGGFNNQRRCLFNALLLGHALNRTVVLAPVLTHNKVGYGSCPHVRSPDSLRKVAVSGPSLRLLLRLENVSEGKTVIVRALDSQYDCSNTVWSFANKKCHRNVHIFDKAPTLLRWGSTFKGYDLGSFDKAHPGVRSRLLRATLEYTEPMERAVQINATYAAVHLRGSDGEFKRRFETSIARAFRQLSHLEKPLVFVASDISLTTLRRKKVFRDGVKSLQAKIFSLKDVLKHKSASKRVYEAALQCDWPEKRAKALAKTPELELHLDFLLAANAQLGFAGTSGSSFSSSVRNLRKFKHLNR